MKEKPIIFTAPMVKEILEGRKTQTRRIVGQKHIPFLENINTNFLYGNWEKRPLPYGQPGDRLWVREKFKTVCDEEQWDAIEYLDGIRIKPELPDHNTGFRFSWDCDNDNVRWRPSIHMPRWASRITLEVTGVRVERLQDISGPDCWAEGIECAGWDSEKYGSVTHCYRDLWESINGPGSWDKNPWVWVIEFKRV